ncbi:hypothetical protein Ahy_A05g023039 [Arachis hypogaea]|uniref:Uncharacterized protein n=1 Tax=Arachis hypogaea TaxID=3818 RepID=A0A445D285_ARAHY|nr:hypothetical protein Ahy_A05g023039 [Arachis hypogaea]
MEALVSKDGVMLLGYQVRSLEAHKKFWEMCDEVWISRIPHDHLHPEYAYEEIDVFLLWKKKKQ